jgi:hypothetical protein
MLAHCWPAVLSYGCEVLQHFAAGAPPVAEGLG